MLLCCAHGESAACNGHHLERHAVNGILLDHRLAIAQNQADNNIDIRDVDSTVGVDIRIGIEAKHENVANDTIHIRDVDGAITVNVTKLCACFSIE